MTRRPARFLSLFSGCGGFDLGFHAAGFRSIGAIDINPAVLRVHESNIDSPVFCADLSTGALPFDDLGRCDILIAGSPCQGFSTLGKRRLNDPRNNLLLVAGKVAARYMPKIVVAENVPGVVSGKHRKYWEALCETLRIAGYQTAEIQCDGSSMGVAQRRKRLILLAWRTKRDVIVNVPTIPGGTLRQALVGINGLANHDVERLSRNSDDYKIARNLKPGQKLSNVREGSRAVHTWDIPEVFGATTPRERQILENVLRLRRRIRVRNVGDADPVSTRYLHREYGAASIVKLVKKGFLKRVGPCHDLVGTFNGKYRRLSLDEPSYTVDTKFGNPKYFLHPTDHRGFSVREAARIQGFPDHFVFSGSRTEQFRMIGNAVPPPMAKNLARFIKEAFEL